MTTQDYSQPGYETAESLGLLAKDAGHECSWQQGLDPYKQRTIVKLDVFRSRR